MGSGDRPKSLILVGPSRYGKTEWARSLGAHWYFNGLFNMDEIHGSVDYAVFDDVNIEFFLGQYKGWFGAQKEFTLTDKYKGKRKLLWGKPIIWCCNESPMNSKGVDSDWLEANTMVVYIANKLF